MSSIIKTLTVQRVGSASPYTNPIQWSENQQLAINNGSQLTVLDPKLPSLSSSITKYGDVVVLDPKTLFHTTNVLHGEYVDTLPVRKFNKVVVDSLDESYQIRNINDLSIVRHQWSPCNQNSRDNVLGVLFNSGEFLIFERQNTYLDKYRLKIDLFEYLCTEFEVSFSGNADEISVTNDQLQSIKVKDFSFSEFSADSNTITYLTIITNNGYILIYQFTGLNNDIPKLVAKFWTGFSIISHQWSAWSVDPLQSSTTSESPEFYSYLSLVRSDNSVVYFRLNQTTGSVGIHESEPIELVQPSRFLIEKTKWIKIKDTDDNLLLVTSTRKLRVFKINDFNDIASSEQTLENLASVVGIAHSSTKQVLNVTIGFENGRFESFIIDLSTITIEKVPSPKELTSFISKSLYLYQFSNSDEDKDIGEDDASSTIVKAEPDVASIPPSNGNETAVGSNVKQPLEGTFINYGFEIRDNGLATLIFKIVPKDVLYYEIESQSELQVAFITIEGIFHPHSATNSTAIAHLNNFWLTNYSTIPTYPSTTSQGNSPSLEDNVIFTEQIKQFKQTHFNQNPLSEFSIEEGQLDCSFESALLKHFNQSSTTKSLQLVINFNKIILSALSNVEGDAIVSFKESIVQEILESQISLKTRLIETILQYLQVNETKISSEIDKFLVIQYYLELKEIDPGRASNYFDRIPKEAEITIRTKFFEESFRTTIDDIVEDESHLINSTTNHKWSKCTLTNLPLLQLNNKKDELGEFNYILYDSTLMGPSDFVTGLLNSIQYSFISGNKSYSVN